MYTLQMPLRHVRVIKTTGDQFLDEIQLSKQCRMRTYLQDVFTSEIKIYDSLMLQQAIEGNLINSIFIYKTTLAASFYNTTIIKCYKEKVF